MGNPFQLLDKLRTNIYGGASGGGSTTSIARQTPIEMAQESPTSILDKDPLGFSSLSYPKNLINDVTNGHYMLFYINRQNNSRFPYTDAATGVSYGERVTKSRKVSYTSDEVAGSIPQGPSGSTTTYKVKEKYEEFTTGGGAIQDSHPFLMTQAKKTNQAIDYSDVKILRKQSNKMRTGLAANFKPTTRITDSIAIYLPPNVQDSYSTKYSGAETGLIGFVAASGGDFMKAYKRNDFRETAQILMDTASNLGAQIGINAALSIAEMVTSAEGGIGLANKIFGQTTNPYMEVLFGGVDLRTFTYNFTFAPRNQFEQTEVKKIIHLFRFHQAPELRNNQSIFMGLPSEFDIHYMYQHEDGSKAKENQFYNKIATCVLTNVSVDYTPGAVQSHADGSPVKITMSLSFLETEMITKDHIEAGY
jgi:hypothetical protein